MRPNMMITAAELKKKLQEAFSNGFNYGRYIMINSFNSGETIIGDEYKKTRGIAGVAIKFIPDEFNYPK